MVNHRITLLQSVYPVPDFCGNLEVLGRYGEGQPLLELFPFDKEISVALQSYGKPPGVLFFLVMEPQHPADDGTKGVKTVGTAYPPLQQNVPYRCAAGAARLVMVTPFGADKQPVHKVGDTQSIGWGAGNTQFTGSVHRYFHFLTLPTDHANDLYRLHHNSSLRMVQQCHRRIHNQNAYFVLPAQYSLGGHCGGPSGG